MWCGVKVKRLEYSGQLDVFGTLALIEEHDGRVCRRVQLGLVDNQLGLGRVQYMRAERGDCMG